MKNKLLVIAIALALTLGFVACGGKESGATFDKESLTDALSAAASAASEETASSAASEVSPPAASEVSAPATVEIAEATEDRLAQYANYDEFDAATDDYGIRLLLTTDSTLRELRLFRLTWNEAVQGLVEAEGGALYQQKELTPAKPLVVWVSIPGTMPTVGLAFIDADGTTKSYHIIMSGEDGSMQLAEATPITE